MTQEFMLHPTPAEVWATLYAVNVNDHTEKTFSGLTYLSWTWAWQIMKEHYPQFTVEWHDVIFIKDPSGFYTVEVSCTVYIGKHVEAFMWLPVMNPKKGPGGQLNESERNPTSRQIGDTKMRCLVKAFAILGLGLYIYAGEDVPVDSVASVALAKKLRATVDTLKNVDFIFTEDAKADVNTALQTMNEGMLESVNEDLLEALEEFTSN